MIPTKAQKNHLNLFKPLVWKSFQNFLDSHINKLNVKKGNEKRIMK